MSYKFYIYICVYIYSPLTNKNPWDPRDISEDGVFAKASKWKASNFIRCRDSSTRDEKMDREGPTNLVSVRARKGHDVRNVLYYTVYMGKL